MGFCVAITRKGSGTLWVSPAIVTWRSCITSSRALCTLAGARLISSASSRWVKTGASVVLNSPVFWLYMRVPTRSAGTRSGVNWMRLKLPWMVLASVFTVSVLARPGTPSTGRSRVLDGHRKPDADEGACRRGVQDGGDDAHRLAIGCDRWATGVAGVGRSIELDQVAELALAFGRGEFALEARDHAR